jgi:hypothetical protein
MKKGGGWMKKDLVLVLLVVFILALLVPLTDSAWHCERAFTYDNLIFFNTSANF